MKRVILVLFTLVLLNINSCNDSVSVNDKEFYQATVLGKGPDCSETYLIKFNKNQIYFEQNSYYDPYVFYANDLPEEFKVKNLVILIKFRNPAANESYFCTHSGVPYPHIIILEAKRN